MAAYLARLCWNRAGWSRPSGDAAKAEGPATGSKPTFASIHGYGHEEWLFRPEHATSGWRYGFLQPSLNKASEGLYGQELDVILYTIDPYKRRLYLGRIDGLVVLDNSQAELAVREFERGGWLAAMREDLVQLGLSPKSLWRTNAAREKVNVKYRPERVHMLPEALEAPRDDVTKKKGKNRYIFYPLSELPNRIVSTHADPSRPVDPYTYRTAPIIHADQRHNRLQHKLARMLIVKYGREAVRVEDDGVDIVLTQSNSIVYVEVKSEPDARLAIREALGQLLEYALFAPRHGTRIPQLVVVGPGEPDAAVDLYIDRIRTEFGVPLQYVCFNEASDECPL